MRSSFTAAQNMFSFYKRDLAISGI